MRLSSNGIAGLSDTETTNQTSCIWCDLTWMTDTDRLTDWDRQTDGLTDLIPVCFPSFVLVFTPFSSLPSPTLSVHSYTPPVFLYFIHLPSSSSVPPSPSPPPPVLCELYCVWPCSERSVWTQIRFQPLVWSHDWMVDASVCVLCDTSKLRERFVCPEGRRVLLISARIHTHTWFLLIAMKDRGLVFML